MSVERNQRGNPVPDIKTFKVTGAAAINLTCNPKCKFRLLNMTVHAAGAIANAITITLDSKEGAVYDTLLSTDSAWTNLYKVFDSTEVFENGDQIVIACAEAATVKSLILRVEVL